MTQPFGAPQIPHHREMLLGPILTDEMSHSLDKELSLNIRKADIMRESGHLQSEAEYITFIRNQMMNKAYPRIRDGFE